MATKPTLTYSGTPTFGPDGTPGPTLGPALRSDGDLIVSGLGTQPAPIRPATISSLSQIVAVDDANEIRAASPTTVYSYSGGTAFFESKSSTTGVYSDARKALFHLARPLDISITKYFVQFVMGHAAVSNATTLVSQNYSHLYRLKAITAQYDPTTLTWNDYAGLTLESEYNEWQIVTGSGSGFSAGVTHSESVTGGQRGIVIERSFSALAPLAIYGWVLETKIVAGTSSTASLLFSIPSNSISRFFAFNWG